MFEGQMRNNSEDKRTSERQKTGVMVTLYLSFLILGFEIISEMMWNAMSVSISDFDP
jgi:hypothetical protein